MFSIDLSGGWGCDALDQLVVGAVEGLCRPNGADAVALAEMGELAAAALRGGVRWLSAGTVCEACQMLATAVQEGGASLQAVSVCQAVLEACSSGRLDGVEAGNMPVAESIARAIWNAKESVAPEEAMPPIQSAMHKADVSLLRSLRGRAAAHVWAHAGRAAAERMCREEGQTEGGLRGWAEKRCGEIGGEAAKAESAGEAILKAEEAHELMEMGFLWGEGGGGCKLEALLPQCDGGDATIVYVLRLLHLRGLEALLSVKGEAGVGWPVWALVKAWGNRDDGEIAHLLDDSFISSLWPWLSQEAQDIRWERTGAPFFLVSLLFPRSC